MSTAGVLVGMSLLLGFCGLAIDLAVLHLYEDSGISACESAALAGAAELWDREVLCPSLRRLEFAAGEAEGERDRRRGESLGQQQVRRALRAAQAYAAENRVGDARVELRPEDVTIQLSRGRYASLRIECPFNEERGNPMTRFFGRLLGHGDHQATVVAEARLDQRVYGLEPGRDAAVHLAPLLIHPESWRRQVCSGKITIHLAVERQESGRSRGRQEERGVGRGNGVSGAVPDGGSAWLLTLAPAGDEDDADETAPPLSRRQTLDGVVAGDLQALGGRFAIDGAPLILRRSAVAEVALKEICRDLRVLAAERRELILPLGRPQGGAREILDLAAGQILDCNYNGDSRVLTVVLAPRLTTTTAALVRRGEPVNPWIGKLHLVR